jgi:two-component system, NtrC family, nitrogen regulation sensor histidine kinase GlnL
MMRVDKSQLVSRYLISIGISGLALAVIAVLQPVVGFLELLYLLAVAFVDAYAGEGPAGLSIILCTVGSFWVIGRHPVAVDQRLHDITKLAVFPLVGAGLLYLMRARRQRKKAAIEQLSELSTLLETIPEAVFIFDSSGHAVVVNNAALALCGGERDELAGADITKITSRLGVERESGPIPYAELAVARALRGEAVRDERRICRSRGEQDPDINMLVSAYPMRGEEGEIIGALVLLRDITEMTQMQQRMAATERHMIIGQMATSIAHDFNNVLNTIQEAAAVLELPADQMRGDRKVYVSLINKAVRRGVEVVQRLREYVRGGTSEVASLDLIELLNEVLELTRPLSHQAKGITIVTDFRRVAPVRANGADLRRAFTNLILNAIQAMPGGGEIKISTEQREDRVQARVQDNGPGIPSDTAKEMFLPYFTTKPAGTGLGLSTAQKIVLSQGGNISFTSEPGKGTCFLVELPAEAEGKLLRAA